MYRTTADSVSPSRAGHSTPRVFPVVPEAPPRATTKKSKPKANTTAKRTPAPAKGTKPTGVTKKKASAAKTAKPKSKTTKAKDEVKGAAEKVESKVQKAPAKKVCVFFFYYLFFLRHIGNRIWVFASSDSSLKPLSQDHHLKIIIPSNESQFSVSSSTSVTYTNSLGPNFHCTCKCIPQFQVLLCLLQPGRGILLFRLKHCILITSTLNITQLQASPTLFPLFGIFIPRRKTLPQEKL